MKAKNGREQVMNKIVLDLGECGTFIVELTSVGGGACSSDQHYTWGSKETKEVFGNVKAWSSYEGQIDALESLVLAHAIAGVDISSAAYKEGLKTTLQALGNQ